MLQPPSHLVSLAIAVFILLIVTDAEDSRCDVLPCSFGCCWCDLIHNKVSCTSATVTRILSNSPERTTALTIDGQIMNVSKYSFSHLSQLTTLELNNIAHIEDGAFQTLVNLRSLSLNQIELGLFDNSRVLFGIYSVEALDLRYNRLTILPDLSSAANVTSLNLSDNLFTSIPD